MGRQHNKPKGATMKTYDMAYINTKTNSWVFADLELPKKEAQKRVDAINAKSPELKAIVVTFNQYLQLRESREQAKNAGITNHARVIKR